MTRISKKFEALQIDNRAGLVTFTMACDPDFDTALAILKGLPVAGADIIELGMPFSDPMADGPTIQKAGRRALEAGGSVIRTLEMVRAFRQEDDSTPIILMGYYNPIYHFGNEQFCRDAAAAGVDGLIIVDLPPEEEAELRMHTNRLDMIRLIAPTTVDERLKTVLHSASGFVYYISVTGITGAHTASDQDLQVALAKLRAHTNLPIAVGFGIKTPAQVSEAAAMADAVVVGSALISKIEQAVEDGSDPVSSALDFVGELAAALR